jgi:hypothetical protein
VLRQPGEGRGAEGGRITGDDLGPVRREAAAKPQPAPAPPPTIEPASLLQAFKSDTVKVKIYHGMDEKTDDVVREARE